MPFGHGINGRALERDPPGDQVVGNEPELVNVRSGLSGVAAELFWRPPHGQFGMIGGRYPVGAECSVEPEVEHLDDARRADRDALRCQAAVDDPVAVCVGERRADADEHMDCPLEGHGAIRADVIGQGPAGHLFGDQVVGRAVAALDPRCITAPVEHRCQRRVGEVGGGLRLRPEPLDEAAVCGEVG